jgi:hypothetical protein
MSRHDKYLKLILIVTISLVAICVFYPGSKPTRRCKGISQAHACAGGGDGEEENCPNPYPCRCAFSNTSYCNCSESCEYGQNACSPHPPLMVYPYEFNGIFVQGEGRIYDLVFEVPGDEDPKDLEKTLCTVVVTIEEQEDADGNPADAATLLNIYNNNEEVPRMIFPRSQIIEVMSDTGGYYGSLPIAIQAKYPLTGHFPYRAQLVATINNQYKKIYPFQIKQHVPIEVGLESYVEQYFVCYDSRLSYDEQEYNEKKPLKAFISFNEGYWDNPDLLGYTLGSVNIYVTDDAAMLIKEDGTECGPGPDGADGCWLTYEGDELYNIMHQAYENAHFIIDGQEQYGTYNGEGYYGEFNFSIRGVYPQEGVELFIEVNGPPDDNWQETTMLTAFPVNSPLEISGLYETDTGIFNQNGNEQWELWNGTLCACNNEDTNTTEEQRACWKTVDMELKFVGGDYHEPNDIFDNNLPCELTLKITDEKDADGNTADNIVVMLYSGDEVKERSYDKAQIKEAMSAANGYWGKMPVSFKGNNPGTAKLIAYLNGYENTVVYSQEINVFKVIILQNGTPITNTIHPESVGNKISLKGMVVPSSLTITNRQWTIPGKSISNYVVNYTDENNPTSAKVIGLTNDDLIISSINFYWVDGGDDRQVEYSVIVEGTPCKGKATFDVKRPDVSVITSTGTVSLDVNNYDEPGMWLHYGNPLNPGITFLSTISYQAVFTGKTQWVQLLTDHLDRIMLQSSEVWCENTKTGLDTYYPASKAVDFKDWPGLKIEDLVGGSQVYHVSKAEVYQKFRTWLMFKPTGNNSIWVPLMTVDWDWGGTAEEDEAGWWRLINPFNTEGPMAVDSIDHPEWKKIYIPPRWHYHFR